MQYFDWSYKILETKTFLCYEDKFSIDKILWKKFIFQFIDKEAEKQRIFIKPIKTDSTEVKIELYNFNNTLGLWTTDKFKIWNLDNWDSLYFGIYSKNVWESFRHITICFYSKQITKDGEK